MVCLNAAQSAGKIAGAGFKSVRSANGDAFGVFLIRVPMSSRFGGDKEGQVAVAKDKSPAIENALMRKACAG